MILRLLAEIIGGVIILTGAGLGLRYLTNTLGMDKTPAVTATSLPDQEEMDSPVDRNLSLDDIPEYRVWKTFHPKDKPSWM